MHHAFHGSNEWVEHLKMYPSDQVTQMSQEVFSHISFTTQKATQLHQSTVVSARVLTHTDQRTWDE